jgi:7-cyano-7-deazaguanine synthase
MSTIVLLSGGLDSATVLALCRSEGKECHALSFRYGQRHGVEIESAKRIAAVLGAATHRICAIDVQCLSGSALTGQGDVPKGRSEQDIGHGIPSTYVPARNTLFAAHALALAESIGADEIALGINALDYSGYPDCRPEWLAAMQELARLGTKVGVNGKPIRFIAPLVQMSKADIVHKGTELGVDYGMTVSCYDPAFDGAACGACDSCVLRRRGFERAGVPDPTSYRR